MFDMSVLLAAMVILALLVLSVQRFSQTIMFPSNILGDIYGEGPAFETDPRMISIPFPGFSLTDLGEALGDAAEDTVKALGDAAEVTGRALGGAANTTGRALGGAAEVTGEALGDAAEATGNFIGSLSPW